MHIWCTSLEHIFAPILKRWRLKETFWSIKVTDTTIIESVSLPLVTTPLTISAIFLLTYGYILSKSWKVAIDPPITPITISLALALNRREEESLVFLFLLSEHVRLEASMGLDKDRSVSNSNMMCHGHKYIETAFNLEWCFCAKNHSVPKAASSRFDDA